MKRLSDIEMKALLQGGERHDLEFKAADALRRPHKLAREVVGMLNGDGGRVIVGVDITHRWNEDITIKLTAPSGQSTRLKEVKASGLVEGLDIERTFVTTALNGQSSKGKWTLKVADAFDGGDGKDGVFNSWTLEVKFHKGFDVFATANTDKKGNYLLDNLPGKRTYNISPSKSGFQFQPKSRDIAVEKKPVKNIKFTGKRKKGKPQKRGPQSKPEGQRS